MIFSRFSAAGEPERDVKQGGKVIYVYDALCGWCYGFSPVIRQLHENYNQTLDFEILSGGMITGERIGPVSDMADYISQAYLEVENRTGIKFGEEFIKKTLNRDDVIFTSVTPAIALSAFKTLLPQKAFQFASSIHEAIYFQGLSPDDQFMYGSLAAGYGIEPQSFTSMMNDANIKLQAEAEFRRSKELGVSGFPTTIYEDASGNRTIISRGYVNYEQLVQRLEHLLSSK